MLFLFSLACTMPEFPDIFQAGGGSVYEAGRKGGSSSSDTGDILEPIDTAENTDTAEDTASSETGDTAE